MRKFCLFATAAALSALTLVACGGGGSGYPTDAEIAGGAKKGVLTVFGVGYRLTSDGLPWPYIIGQNRWFLTQKEVFDDMSKCERLTKIGVPQYCNVSTVHFDGPAVLDPVLPPDAPRVGGHYWGCVGNCSPGNSWDYQDVWINISKQTVIVTP